MASPRCWAWIQVPALYPLQRTRRGAGRQGRILERTWPSGASRGAIGCQVGLASGCHCEEPRAAGEGHSLPRGLPRGGNRLICEVRLPRTLLLRCASRSVLRGLAMTDRSGRSRPPGKRRAGAQWPLPSAGPGFAPSGAPRTQVPAVYPLQGTRPWRTVECEGVQGAAPFGAHPRCTRRGARRGEGVRAMIRQAAFGTDCWNGMLESRAARA